MMEITSVRKDQITTFTIVGKFDATTSKEVEAYLMGKIDNTYNQVILDLNEVSYLSSAGVRVMLATMQDARKAGGDLRLSIADGNIKKVVDIAGFSKIMKIFDSVDDAVGSYSDS